MTLISILLAVLPYCQPNSPEIEQECARWIANDIAIETVVNPGYEFEYYLEQSIETLPARFYPKE